MTTRLYGYGALLKLAYRPDRKPRRSGSKVARELAGGNLITSDGRIGTEAWPPVFVMEGWPPPMDTGASWITDPVDQDWPPTDAGWPGGRAWAVEVSPFPLETETDPFARCRDIDPQSPKGRWLAGMDRNFGPGWEDWDGHVTVDLNRS